MADEVMDWLMSGGAKYFPFPDIGTTIEGEVLSLRKQQQRDMDTNVVKTFDNGDPMMELVIELQTDLEESDDDDGKRSIYAKSGMLKAVQQAFRDAGLTRESPSPLGGALKVRYHGDGEKKKGKAAMKLYIAKFTPAPPKARSDDWDDEPAAKPAAKAAKPAAASGTRVEPTDDSVPF